LKREQEFEQLSREPSQAMGAACGDPGGGEIPMKATKPFAVLPGNLTKFSSGVSWTNTKNQLTVDNGLPN